MAEALVEHDYTAREADELTIRRGDVIREVAVRAGGWWEGVLEDRHGLFPDNFVRLLSDDAKDRDRDRESRDRDREAGVVMRGRREAGRIRQCRVVFSYRQDHEDELDLCVGDMVEVLGEEEEGWWRGMLRGREGVFPSNFVEEIPPAAPVVSRPRPSSRDDLAPAPAAAAPPLHDGVAQQSPSLPARPPKVLCEVRYPYKAENADELTLREGDVVTLVSRDGEDVGWWKGELNGRVGVFPDNFVVVLPSSSASASTVDDRAPGDDNKKAGRSPSDAAKPPGSQASQRRSLENRAGGESRSEVEGGGGGAPRSSPPVPGKKPTLSVKKSPSGIISGIKKKIAEMADAVDGGSASKPAAAAAAHKTEAAADTHELPNAENAFDQVERRPLLSDVRATRAKAPGRRPPSVVYKEGEPGIVNGNSEHANLDILLEQNNAHPSVAVDGESEVKPKLREWEKHKAPWLEEMKLNQAKRTSTSPGPENRLKLTPTDRAGSEPEESKSTRTSPYEKEREVTGGGGGSGGGDMSRSMTALSGKLKTPPNELEKVPVRAKPKLPVPARPQTVHNLNVNFEAQKTAAGQPANTAAPAPASGPVVNNRSPSPMQKPTVTAHPTNTDKPPVESKPNEPSAHLHHHHHHQQQPVDGAAVSARQYQELQERVQRLEALVERQHEAHLAKVEELRGKLQLETDMRMMLQAQLEKVAQAVTVNAHPTR